MPTDPQPSPTTERAAAIELGSLSIVIPVYNERTWIVRAVTAAVDAARASAWDDVEVVVVDDGSTDGTGAVLDELDAGVSLQVVHQENRGRFAAREVGLRHARGEWVLLVDSRVLLDRESLAYVAEHLSSDAEVWNGHVDVNTRGNPYAGFWDALTRLAWARYFDNPRLVSYGLDDFDHYPKGTGCFLARRSLLLEAFGAFETRYDNVRESNDDTTVIRSIAAKHRIWVSPGFRCSYEARGSLREFLRHAMHRGTHLVDGHLRRDSRFAPVIVAFYPASLGALAVTVVWWPAPLLALSGLTAAVTVAAITRGLPRREVADVALLTPAFTLSYGLGMWRGAALAAWAARGSSRRWRG